MAEEDRGICAALAKVVADLPAGGELREGQQRMAEAVSRAIDRSRHLVVQAGTGTGKSLAYLVPALLAGQTVVVSTATKALQDQLAGKDLPFLAERLSAQVGRPLRFAVLKGRSNYLCRQREREVGGGGSTAGAAGTLQLEGETQAPASLRDELRRLLAWAATTPTGDRSELSFEPQARAWAQLSVSAMECPGVARCPAGDTCLADLARQRASEADVIVVNTHLYGAHLASGGMVLPEHDVVVFDEAHELEDICATSLGLELTAGRFANLARTARPLLGPDAKAKAKADRVDEAWVAVERILETWRDRQLPAPASADPSRAGLVDALAAAEQAVAALSSAVSASKGGGVVPPKPDDDGRRARTQQAAGHLRGDLQMVIDLPVSHVSWVEGPPRALVLKVALVDVARTLSATLWSDRSAILTSATIPPGLARRLGLPPDRTDELDAGSPFDYRTQALLYVAKHLPPPRHPEWEAAAQDELARLIVAAGGRTLALFTSFKGMRAAADALRTRLPYRILTQDDLPKPALLAAFTEQETSCLFATMGFWQGVDIPGPSLSLVVLDKLPFPRPDDPLLIARRDRAGAGAFSTVDVPRAATLLAQGVGRLIRSSSDRGVVAVLDSRLATAGYRHDLLLPVPPLKRTITFEDVVAFLAPLRAVAGAPR